MSREPQGWVADRSCMVKSKATVPPITSSAPQPPPPQPQGQSLTGRRVWPLGPGKTSPHTRRLDMSTVRPEP